jgi:hypothetical protein
LRFLFPVQPGFGEQWGKGVTEPYEQRRENYLQVRSRYPISYNINIYCYCIG